MSKSRKPLSKVGLYILLRDLVALGVPVVCMTPDVMFGNELSAMESFVSVFSHSERTQGEAKYKPCSVTKNMARMILDCAYGGKALHQKYMDFGAIRLS